MNFAGKDAVHGLSMSRHLLVRVEVYSEATIALFDSGALPKVMSYNMMRRLHLLLQQTNRSIKVANCVRKNLWAH